MQSIELKTLITKLDPSLRRSLEVAAGLCVSHQHRYIEVEHWLQALFSEPSADIDAVIHSQQLSRQIMLADLESRLAKLEKGNPGTPSLSMSILALIQDAWLIASVNYQHDAITAFHLLLALLQKAHYAILDSPMARELQRISLESLQALAEGQEPCDDAPTDTDTPAPRNIRTRQDAKGALAKYTLNLTDAARNGELRPIIGRQQEIRQVIDILSRQRQNNPILVGDPGVGKTAIVEGLAQRIIGGEVPESMRGVELHTLDLGLLQAGASIRGELESRLKDLINEVKSAKKPILLFVDEAHTLIGAGGAAGQNDAANLLKPALARGELRTIAATTWAEYKKYFEKDAALARRFQLVKVLEPDETDALHIVRGVARSLETYHGVRIHDDAVVAAVKMAVRYLPEQQLPDKAISLLDTACSRVGISRQAVPESIENLQFQYTYTERELNERRRDKAAGHPGSDENIEKLGHTKDRIRQSLDALNDRWQKEQALVEDLSLIEAQADKVFLQTHHENESGGTHAAVHHPEIANLRRELEQLQKEHPMVFPRVDSTIIASILSSWTGIPVSNMLSDEIQRLLTLENHLKARVIGQDDALVALCQCIRTSRAGLADRRKPAGVFLMCGPSGVGKTETALALAEELFGGEQNLTTLNMTEFKEEHKISQLLGSPAGYVGYGEGGLLTEAVRRKPYSVLLLDEMEKAHPGVHDIFYQIFDKGRVSDSEGREVNFCNTIIIMTSNAADYAIMDVVDRYKRDHRRKPDRDEIINAIHDELLTFFKPAFLGRVLTIPYLPLGTEDMETICRLALKRIQKNVEEQYKATLAVSDTVIKQLVAWNNNPLSGARAIEQIVNRNLLPRLAIDCLKRLTDKSPINHIHIDLAEDQLVFNIT